MGVLIDYGLWMIDVEEDSFMNPTGWRKRKIKETMEKDIFVTDNMTFEERYEFFGFGK